ncbi:hypothetical protein COLO4_04228 [Corchorus olitorius]|uniref:Chromo domain-containing protein n=1 Tax=Corchorus olitorius TaxID=93759 RepID=A0A1R3KUR8_9ROSI|nr:hypothetical protein COLO4_04228 [Corchorus olitorius]
MAVAKAIPVPSASCLLFLGDRPCVVPATILPRSGKKIIPALQFMKRIKRGEPSKPTLEYLVKWDGLGLEEVSWERALNLQAFQ